MVAQSPPASADLTDSDSVTSGSLGRKVCFPFTLYIFNNVYQCSTPIGGKQITGVRISIIME